jgi:hypothetical protein
MRPIRFPCPAVRGDEHAEARNGKADIGTTEIFRHVGMAEEISGRMAVEAAAKLNEILSAFHLWIGGLRQHNRHDRDDRRQN